MARVPVLLYVPNIIGYARIVLSAVAIYHWESPKRFSLYYSIGFMLDAADGLAARVFRQSSEFGALLDMLTDRCATAALLTVISVLERRLAPIALCAAFLDGYSHWLQFAAGLCSSAKSHKTASQSMLLELYYWRPMLMFVCTLNEFCFLSIYMMTSGANGPVLLPKILPKVPAALIVFIMCLPICILKQIISVIQVFAAHDTIQESVEAANTLQDAIG